ncbi:MAG: SprT family zinc-dependent metalloprotease [Verrucomicrobiota bacterium]
MHFEQKFFHFDSTKSAKEDWIEIDGKPFQVHYRRHSRAKHYLLYVRRDLSLRVTIPPRGSQKEAADFVTSKKAWILRQIEKLTALPLPGKIWSVGDSVCLAGEDHPIETLQEGSQSLVLIGPLRIPVKSTETNLRPLIESYLQSHARVVLPPRVLELAQERHFSPARITIRNQSSRWGSCSEKGNISLNWRLIQVPPPVCDYVILHELCHLKEMNHSRHFWNLVSHNCPDYKNHELWLKQHAVRLGL